MRRLICTFVVLVSIWQNRFFSWRGSYNECRVKFHSVKSYGRSINLRLQWLLTGQNTFLVTFHWISLLNQVHFIILQTIKLKYWDEDLENYMIKKMKIPSILQYLTVVCGFLKFVNVFFVSEVSFWVCGMGVLIASGCHETNMLNFCPWLE